MLHLVLDRLNQCRGFGFTLFENDEGLDRFPDGLVWLADDGGLRNCMVAYYGAFHFGGSKSIACHLDDVIGTAPEPPVTIRVFMAYIAPRGAAWHRVPIGFVSFGIFVDRPHHRWPGFLNHGDPALIRRKALTLAIDDIGFDAQKRSGSGAGFQGYCGQRRDEDRAGL